jgi:hypothetical protein
VDDVVAPLPDTILWNGWADRRRPLGERR